MTDREKEIRQRMAAMTEEIRTLMADNKLDDAESKTAEMETIKQIIISATMLFFIVYLSIDG